VPIAVDKILGGSVLTRDHRIHLLESRERKSRQIADVPDTVDGISIEGYPLPEETASDEYPIDDKSGLVGYKAPRSRADSQLSYLLRRHVLYNHFYNTEYERLRRIIQNHSFDGSRNHSFLDFTHEV
jgi:hypothetical protein